MYNRMSKLSGITSDKQVARELRSEMYAETYVGLHVKCLFLQIVTKTGTCREILMKVSIIEF
jgi:hypothetical protein